jgi:hypothetical protein
MTSASVNASPSTHTDTTSRRPAVLAVALSALMTLVLIARDTDSGPAWRVGLILSAAIVITATVVFGLVVRRTLAKADARSSAKGALILGILAALSFIVFWMAITPILGVAAVVLARDARDCRPFHGETLATVGGILGALGTIAAIVACIVG